MELLAWLPPETRPRAGKLIGHWFGTVQSKSEKYFVRSVNRLTLPSARSEARHLQVRSTCGLRLRIFGPVWSSSSGELKDSQVSPEANPSLILGLLEGSRVHSQLGEPLEAVLYQRGFSPRDHP